MNLLDSMHDLESAINVLQVIDTLGMGGAETWLMEVLRLWAREGANAPLMHFLVTSGNRGLFDDEAEALGARIFYARYQRSHLPALLVTFARFCAKEDIRQSMTTKTMLVAGIFSWAGAPCLRCA